MLLTMKSESFPRLERLPDRPTSLSRPHPACPPPSVPSPGPHRPSSPLPHSHPVLAGGRGACWGGSLASEPLLLLFPPQGTLFMQTRGSLPQVSRPSPSLPAGDPIPFPSSRSPFPPHCPQLEHPPPRARAFLFSLWITPVPLCRIWPPVLAPSTFAD